MVQFSIISISLNILQLTAVDTPLWSYTGESSSMSNATMLSSLSFKTASRSCKNDTPPASGVPVPGKTQGSNTSKSSVK